MKRTILFIFCTVFLLTSCGNVTDTTNANNSSGMISTDLSFKEIITSINHPDFTNSGTSETIKKQIQNFVDERIALDKKNSKKAKPELTYKKEILVRYNTYYSNKVNSVYYDIFEDLGYTDSTKFVKIFNLDENGDILNSEEMFAIDSSSLNDFKEFVIKNLDSANIKYYSGSWEISKALDNYIFSGMNYYFDEGKIVLVFGQGEIASASEGIIKLNFNIDSLRKYYTKDFTAYLGLKEEVVQNTPKNEDKKNNVVENIQFDDGKKYVALTFDDGPSKANTPRLLEILKENNVKVTFFVLGNNIELYGDILKAQVEDGHEIGIHTRDHPRLTNLGEESIKKQLFNTRQKVYELTGVTPSLMRPPYGLYNDRVKEIWGETIVMWNVDSLDWKYRDVTKNVNQVISTTNPGSIILMHDIHSPTVDSVDSIIKKLKASGYEFVTVSELLKLYQNDDLKKKVCSSGDSCK